MSTFMCKSNRSGLCAW